MPLRQRGRLSYPTAWGARSPLLDAARRGEQIEFRCRADLFAIESATSPLRHLCSTDAQQPPANPDPDPLTKHCYDDLLSYIENLSRTPAEPTSTSTQPAPAHPTTRFSIFEHSSI